MISVEKAKAMLDRTISRENSYILSDYKGNEKKPIVSNTMFQTMINNEKRKEYASYIISLLLDIDYNKVYDGIEFMKDHLDREKEVHQGKTVDFVCRVDGEIIGIEMNNNSHGTSSLDRNIAYAGDLYKHGVNQGTGYNYNEVVQINLNNFSFEGNNKIIETYRLRNEEGEELTKKITFIYVYIPNIKKKGYNIEKLSIFERLMLVLNEKDEKGLKILSRGDEIMEKYVKDSKEASMKEEIIGLYDEEMHLENLRISERKEAIEYGLNEGFEKGMKQGLEQGKKQGMKQGLELGKKQGIEHGKKEEKLKIAKNMLNDNIDVDTIIKYTGLSKEEIQKL